MGLGKYFLDYDNDGDKDLYVANGFTSYEDADAPDFLTGLLADRSSLMLVP